MSKPKMDSEAAVTIRELYPELDDEQLKKAEENLERYLELAMRIYERIRNDPDAYAQFKALTDSSQNPTMHEQRSNSSTNTNPPKEK